MQERTRYQMLVIMLQSNIYLSTSEKLNLIFIIILILVSLADWKLRDKEFSLEYKSSINNLNIQMIINHIKTN
jgi:hypothetical protein